MSHSFSGIPKDALSQSPMIQVINNKASTAAEYAEGLANLLYSQGISRKEMKPLLEGLKEVKALGQEVSIPKVLSSLSSLKKNEELSNSSSPTSTLPPVSFQKFKDQNSDLFRTPELLSPPKALEAQTSGLYRGAFVFLACLGAKGPGYDTRKPILLTWIRNLLGQNPPERNKREMERRNKLKGWSTRELTFPPPFNPTAQKEKAIELLKAHLKDLGKDFDNPALLNQVVSFYFNHTAILTLDYFEELYQGITSLRLKLTNELNRPGSQTFNDEDIKKLSMYMNVMEHELRQDILINKQNQDLLFMREHLLLLEYAHQSLKEVYEHDTGINLHPEVALYEASKACMLDVFEDILTEGKYPDLEYGNHQKQTLENLEARTPSDGITN